MLHIDLTINEADQQLQTIADLKGFQQTLFVTQAHAQMRGDGVGEAAGLINAGQRLQQFRRQLAVGLHVLLEQAHQ